jgi:hypothetical protein
MHVCVALLLLCVSSAAAADPDADAADPDADASCRVVPYLEPSLLWGSGQMRILNRVAAGVLFRRCDDAGRALQNVRVGVTGYVSSYRPGLGLEASADHPVSRGLRLGLRLSAEFAGASGNLTTLGARVHVGDLAFLAIDGYRLSQADLDQHGGPDYGVLGGFGAEGWPGGVLGGTELVIGGIGFVLLAAAWSGAH